MRKTGVPIEAAQLAGASVEFTNLAPLSGIPMADEATIKAVRDELSEKNANLAGLPNNDWARRGSLEKEIQKIEKYLGEVENHKGQPRKVAGTAQRSRASVTAAISRVIKNISAEHPDLGRHLKASIRTGIAPVYAPTEEPDWQF
jgi:hypothetical protein